MNAALGKAEARLFSSWWDDGLLDLLAGAAVAITGIGWSWGLGALAVVQAPLWIALWRPLRRAIVEPRAGFVRFTQGRRERNEKRLGMVLLLGVGILALALLGGLGLSRVAPESMKGSLVDGLPAAIIAMMSAVTAMLTGAKRFAIYAVFLLMSAAVSILAGFGPALPLTLGGLLAALVGSLLLRQFLSASRCFEEEDREGG